MNPNDINFEFQETADPKTLGFLESIEQKISKVLDNLPKSIKFPDVFNIRGDVNVKSLPSVTLTGKPIVTIDELPSIKINNLAELSSELRVLITGLQAALYKTVGDIKFSAPDTVKISNPLVIKDWADLVDGFEELKKGLNILINQEKTGLGDGGKPMEVAITNFPPAMVPQPVTHISINALQGTVKTTATTVGTNLVQLPGYGQLFNRRSIQVYNNSSNTIYIGGSDVTTANGMPVPAASYSQALDLGYNVILYGIAATTGNNIRVIEVSDDASGR